MPQTHRPEAPEPHRNDELRTCGISELTREFMITARAIRFYEDQGLISPTRSGSGGRTRVYSQRDRARLTWVLRGKRLGLSLSEIKGLLDMYETPADTVAQLQRFLTMLDERRDTLLQQLRDLNQTLAEINVHRAQASRMLLNLQPPGMPDPVMNHEFRPIGDGQHRPVLPRT